MAKQILKYTYPDGLPDKQAHNHNGKRFERLVVIGYLGRINKKGRWLVRCDCGNLDDVRGSHLVHGTTKSCGCISAELRRNLTRTHGATGTPEYKSFDGAQQRCRTPNHPGFHRYGGRGIEFRFRSFQHFLSELGYKPSPTHTLDRINNEGHYEPGNVRWATPKEQADNRRTNHKLTVKGVTRSIADWGRVSGFGESVIYGRLRFGWCWHCSVTIPVSRGSCPHRISTGKSEIPHGQP